MIDIDRGAMKADAERETWFARVEKQLAEQTMVIQDAQRRLTSFNNRMVGPIPQNIESNEKAEQVTPNCAMDAVNQQIGLLQDQTNFLTSELARLENAGLV